MPDLPVTIAEAARALVDKLPLSILHQLDELGGDKIKMRRLRRLVSILEEAERIAKSKGILPDDMKVLADHVGLPWMDKASLRDDEQLQNAWANLFVAITTEDNEDLHGNCVRILGEMNPWDCRVLDHVVKNAVILPSDGNDAYISPFRCKRAPLSRHWEPSNSVRLRPKFLSRISSGSAALSGSCQHQLRPEGLPTARYAKRWRCP